MKDSKEGWEKIEGELPERPIELPRTSKDTHCLKIGSKKIKLSPVRKVRLSSGR